MRVEKGVVLFSLSLSHLDCSLSTYSDYCFTRTRSRYIHSLLGVFDVRPLSLSFNPAQFRSLSFLSFCPPINSPSLTTYSFTERVNRSIWSSISSQLHLHQSTSTPNSPPLETTTTPLTSSSSTTITTDCNSTPFEFYDPRGLGNKVRNTRSRSNTPQTGGLSRESSLSAGHNKIASSPGGTFDENGDVRMRIGSEVSSIPIPPPSCSLSHVL